MSKKIGKVLLISGSIVAASALIAISLKKVVDSMDILKVDEDEEENTSKPKYFTIKRYNPSKDSTLSSIKSAGAEKYDIDE